MAVRPARVWAMELAVSSPASSSSSRASFLESSSWSAFGDKYGASPGGFSRTANGACSSSRLSKNEPHGFEFCCSKRVCIRASPLHGSRRVWALKSKSPSSENVSQAAVEEFGKDSAVLPNVPPQHASEIQRPLGPFRPVESTPMTEEAWRLLRSSVVNYCGQPIGTLAACDPADSNPLNYDQVFIRDFIPSALVFLVSGEHEIVRNFLVHTLQLQSWEKTVDCYKPGEGLMPASFKIRLAPIEGGPAGSFEETLDPDFGESAIGRVAPVDSGLWWILLLRAYCRCTGDLNLSKRVDFQTGMKLILKVCLADHFDMFPTLITTDGPCMIDRRLGIHGHPLEIQSLFYAALRAGREMITPENGGVELIRAVNARLAALSFHIREYYWIDIHKLNQIYRYKTEEYSHDAVNKFNIYPEQISSWLMEWMPDVGGYFVGNVQPAHMDFRFFTLGNLWAIASSLADPSQSESILNLWAAKWDDLIGEMPCKICYPALEGPEWRIITGCDPKNTPWSYHNGGSWPVLIWQFTVACIKMGRRDMAEKAVKQMEKRLMKDGWPEYYDTRSGRFIGKQARMNQTWSIAGYLAAKLFLENPHAVSLLVDEEDHDIEAAKCSLLRSNPRRRRRRSSVAKDPPCPLF